MLRKLIRFLRHGRRPAANADQLRLAARKAFLSVVDLSISEGLPLTIIIEAGGESAGVMLKDGKEDKLIEYIYNWACSMKLKAEAAIEEKEMGRLVLRCEDCLGWPSCLLFFDKRHQCKRLDVDVSDAEASHIG